MRHVPSTMTKALSISSPNEPISVAIAKEQHHMYSKALEEIVPRSIQLAADDKHPDCVFIEDTAVVIDKHAVICRIGATSRRGEVAETREALSELGLSVSDMTKSIENANCDGGDVLYPVSYRISENGVTPIKKGGAHLFVGISSRTNNAGADFLQKAFPYVEVIPVQLRKTKNEALHLKSIVTHIDENTLLMPVGEEWDYLLTSMSTDNLGYNVIRLPDQAACNVVSANGNVIAQPNICEDSKNILRREVEARGMNLSFVDASEFAKCDGALTCKSILLHV